ncbi:ABC transporter substrate-binding protein [Chloroflexota bacterium]
MKVRFSIVFGLLIIISMILAACAPAAPETIVETVIVTQEVEVEGEMVVETVIVEVEVTEEPAGPVEFVSDDPETYTHVVFGDVDTFDPAWNYETFGDGILEDTLDMLVAYKGPDATGFAPELATSWEISEDGTMYTFTIREGVKFHEGQDLDPEDVAYSFQRGLLQGGGWSPQWLYTEAFFGPGTYDIAELVNPDCADDAECLQAEDPAALLAACEAVTNAIYVDGQDVTFQLAQSWGPLLATIAGSWGGIIDKDWGIENGTWDGDCATWQNYYGIGSGTGPIQTIINGTGPYKLDHWTPGEEVVLVANEDYWRDEPTYEGGPTGAPRIKRVVMSEVDEWGTRFAMLQAGDADYANVPTPNYAQVDPLVGEWCDYVDVGEWDCHITDNPDAPLRLYRGYPLTSRADAFFTFDMDPEGNNYIGSGQLDGNGIPPDFFADEHVRKAMNWCFDYDALVNDAYSGEAIQNYGPINMGTIGYDNEAEHFSYDEEKCIEELQLAWDGQVWENGFRFSAGYNTGNLARQTALQILQSNLRGIDPKFQVEIVSLPWPAFLAGIRASHFPIFFSGWGEDIHDPHNWAQPFLIGTYAHRQNMPDWMLEEFQALVNAGVTGLTDEERAEAYSAIQKLDFEYAPGIRGAVPTGRTYQQRWVADWIYNPMLRFPFYDYSNE